MELVTRVTRLGHEIRPKMAEGVLLFFQGNLEKGTFLEFWTKIT
jgi:hypothetical protein